MCENEAINGVTMDGGYAEYVLLRTEAVVRVPEDVDPVEYAPIMCAGITVFNSIRKQNIIMGELVAVLGLGGLGHLALQCMGDFPMISKLGCWQSIDANKMGYRTVAISSDDKKRQFAMDLGAHEYIDSSKGDVNAQLKAMGGAALIVATAPNPKVIGPLVGGLQPGGHLLVLSPAGKIEVDTAPLIMYGASVAGYPSGHALDSEEAVAFTKLHNLKCMVEPFPLKDAQKAYDHMMSGKVRFRSVLVMDM
jgi:D-arabinose 1-dehydrogenase-like Zn-dependent alcohol dehydrogenase